MKLCFNFFILQILLYSSFLIFLVIISVTCALLLQKTKLARPAPCGAINFLQFLKIDICSMNLNSLNLKIL